MSWHSVKILIISSLVIIQVFFFFLLCTYFTIISLKYNKDNKIKILVNNKTVDVGIDQQFVIFGIRPPRGIRGSTEAQ